MKMKRVLDYLVLDLDLDLDVDVDLVQVHAEVHVQVGAFWCAGLAKLFSKQTTATQHRRPQY